MDAGQAEVSIGIALILALLVISSALVAFQRPRRVPGLTLWTSARMHDSMYEPMLAAQNAERPPDQHLTPFLISADALARRMNSGFTSDTPIADLLEVERGLVGQTFAGPIDEIGWTDLTPLIEQAGLDQKLNAPSFQPWSWHGHIYGLPHDVHPIMLAYRADLVEAAGIDVSKIETWDDFFRIMRPLQTDADHDGQPDRYLLNCWYTSMDQVEALNLQAGGGYFDLDGHLIIDSDANAMVLAHVIAWGGGADRVAADAPEFSASGNQLRLNGYVVASLMPDWLSGVWKNDMPGLAGKVKLMPLPAWTPGGRRTSVWGGTMLGIPRRTKDLPAAWKAAQELYLSPTVARKLYESNGIISPVKAMWSDPMYDKPDPYFCGQPTGRLYIAFAPSLPPRASSPFQSVAHDRMQDALVALHEYAESHHQYDAAALQPEAKRLLGFAAEQVNRQMSRNVFVRELSQ